MEAFWQARRAEACVLLSKGGLSAKTARAFLAQHGAAYGRHCEVRLRSASAEIRLNPASLIGDAECGINAASTGRALTNPGPKANEAVARFGA